MIIKKQKQKKQQQQQKKQTPDTPKNGSRLIQMIKMGKSIRHKGVKIGKGGNLTSIVVRMLVSVQFYSV